MGYTSASPYGHYSAIKTIETSWNLPLLTSYDSNAPVMAQFFTTPPSTSGVAGGRRPLEM
ncbi:MAG TPA: hypothetical protein VGA05_06650 [Candidatus Bathyarchaeia archaeon]